MIIQEKETEWEIIKQHDHAFVSWQAAVNWNPSFFPYDSRREEVLLAIRNHDRAWIPLDDQSRWNEKKEEPYGFTTYPLEDKLAAYRKGIDETEEMSAYSALLCSMHYSSFFPEKESNPDNLKQFLEDEKQRRKNIHGHLKQELTNEEVTEHLKMLQFGDDLSLYICLNSPGVRKEDEFPWFRDGFRQRFSFAPSGIKAAWSNESIIELSPFPLLEETEITVPVYHIKKTSNKETFLNYWKSAVPTERKIMLTTVTSSSL